MVSIKKTSVSTRSSLKGGKRSSSRRRSSSRNTVSNCVGKFSTNGHSLGQTCSGPNVIFYRSDEPCENNKWINISKIHVIIIYRYFSC